MTTLAPDVDTAACDDLTEIRATIDAGLARHASEAGADERQKVDIEGVLAELQKLAAEPEVESAPVNAAA